jgi:AcrR family transcriptional regulator
MSGAGTSGRVHRTGRRSGDSGTREAILEAARARFAEHGYDGATIRGIAADAGVDPALVHHFYGTKERLFAEALRFPAIPSEILDQVAQAEADRLGETFVRTVLQVWESPETRDRSIALLRSAVTNEQAAAMLRSFVEGGIFGAIARVVGDDDAEFRASLVASQIVGLGIARIVLRIEPIASAHIDELAAAIGPTVQRYLTGDVRGWR